MSCADNCKSIIEPLYNAYEKAYEAKEFDKFINFYHPDAVLVHSGKHGFYGREAIKAVCLEYCEKSGKILTNKTENTEFKSTSDCSYVIMTGQYTCETEKLGKFGGKITQVWRKVGDSYQIYHDEFTADVDV